jgi:hypothetical protein
MLKLHQKKNESKNCKKQARTYLQRRHLKEKNLNEPYHLSL